VASWKSLSEEEKKPYVEEADRLKEIHKKENPDYLWQPNKRKSNPLKPPTVKKNENEDLASEFKPKTKTAFKGYFCKKCRLGFFLKTNLFKHLKYYHPEDPLESKPHELTVGIIVGDEGDEVKMMKCDDCRAEFQTRSELSRHLYMHHQEMNSVAEPTSTSAPSAKRSQIIEEEPVTFEAFRKYFDTEDVERDPQDYFDTSYTYPTEPVTSSSDKVNQSYDYDGFEEPKKAHSKTRFTEQQRTILMDSFHKSITMSKNDAKQMYEDLADSLDLPSKIVRIWFQNARSARKRGNPLYS